MNLQQLRNSGGVVADALVAKEIEWTRLDADGAPLTERFTVHVRRHAFGVMETLFAAGDAERFRNARYLSASILLGPDGSEELPLEDAVNLDPGLGLVLLAAVNEVNNPPAKR